MAIEPICRHEWRLALICQPATLGHKSQAGSVACACERFWHWPATPPAHERRARDARTDNFAARGAFSVNALLRERPSIFDGHCCTLRHERQHGGAASPISATRPSAHLAKGARSNKAQRYSSSASFKMRVIVGCQPSKSARASAFVPRSFQDSIVQSSRSTTPTKLANSPRRRR